ncbi:MAG: hypothetical protein ACYTG5_13005 [Planctomycetota bacterium]|jgi:hypothetical protein
MLQNKLTLSVLAFSLSILIPSAVSAQSKAEQDPEKAAEQKAAERPTPVEKVKNIIAHPGETAARPSRRPESTGIQQGIRRDRMHRADLVNKPNRNYDYYGFNYPRREAGAYSRPIRRYSSYGYPSRRYGYGYRSYYGPRSYYGGSYYGGRSYYRSYNSYRSYGYRNYGYRGYGYRRSGGYRY